MTGESLAYYIEWLFEDIEKGFINSYVFNKIKRIYRREFRGIMPNKYLILPNTLKMYVMSKTLCCEFPANGSFQYREKLNDIFCLLQKYFFVNKRVSDGKVVYQIRGNNNVC